MTVTAEFRKHWFVTMLCTLGALIFVVSLLLSALNYVKVIDAREKIVLANAVELADQESNGSLVLGISIELRNPSKYDLILSSVSWSVTLDISDLGGDPYLPLASVYIGANESLIVKAGKTTVYKYEVTVSDDLRLSKLREFINYSAQLGHVYTFENAPYVHDFRLMGWIDNFRHDYQYEGEAYLNDMVRIERTYTAGEYA